MARQSLPHYLLSLPERVVRSATALAAGLLQELSDVVIPARLRRTRLYENLVGVTLRFLIENVGQVDGVYPPGDQIADDFLVRRTAGNGLEWLGILAFNASPVWVMAALADLSGAGRQLMHEISHSLEEANLVEPGTRFDTVDQLLDGLERSAARVAQTINTPPLDVAQLRREWYAIRQEVNRMATPKLPSPDSLLAVWLALQQEAARQGRTVWEISALLALAAARRAPQDLYWFSRVSLRVASRTGEVIASSLLSHYAGTLAAIQERGFLTYWREEFRPYLKAAALQFSPRRPSLTSHLLARATRAEPLAPRACPPTDSRASGKHG